MTVSLSRADEPHPEVRSFLELYESLDVPAFADCSPADARRVLEAGFGPDDVEPPTFDLESVVDRTIEGPGGDLPIRYYEPGTSGDERPLLLYVHGGGWVIGSLETHDATCRKLAAESGYPVVSVDYRLAPEHPFPAGLEDCYASLEWAAETAPELDCDPNRIVVAGDSAGGNLAAATALLARDRDGPEIAYQLLIYPATGNASETPAYEENGEGYFLTAEDMTWFGDHYFAREIDRGNVYARPRLARDLSNLPPATVVTAGFDPLRDDGAAYAERLADAGVSVSHHHYDDVIHGFFGMVAAPIEFERAHEAHDDAVADLRSALE